MNGYDERVYRTLGDRNRWIEGLRTSSKCTISTTNNVDGLACNVGKRNMVSLQCPIGIYIKVLLHFHVVSLNYTLNPKMSLYICICVCVTKPHSSLRWTLANTLLINVHSKPLRVWDMLPIGLALKQLSPIRWKRPYIRNYHDIFMTSKDTLKDTFFQLIWVERREKNWAHIITVG